MSAKALIARPLDPHEQAAWDSLARSHGTIFDSLRWTDLFGPNLTRVGIFDAGGNLRGGFSLWGQRPFGLRILRNPPYTPQIGPFYEPRATNAAARTDEQRAVVEAMAHYLSANGAAIVSLGLALGLTDCLPFRWRGWKIVPHYTYRLDLKANADTLLQQMSIRQRNPIRKATKDGILVEAAQDTADLRLLATRTFARQEKKADYSSMDAVLAGYAPGDRSYCFLARSHGLPIAGVFVVHDSRTAYSLITGYDDVHSHSGAGAVAMWHAILRAKDLGLEHFDFEGSVIPAIERHFRGFGGVLTPVFSVNRAWLPLEVALKLVRRHLY